LALPGLFAFGILFFWQLPHFAAISIYLKDDFRRAGFKVLPLVHGEAATRRAVFAFTLAMVLWSLLALPFGVAGVPYTVAAAILGAAFVAVASLGLAGASDAAARRTFLFTLFYLPLLVTALVLDRL
jgi:protoheme IX farnesyltransferase